MAKRKKKQGANFGARSGGGSVEAYKKRERSRVGIYTVAGIAAVVIFCLVVWLLSRPAPVSDSVDSGGDSAETSSNTWSRHRPYGDQFAAPHRVNGSLSASQ